MKILVVSISFSVAFDSILIVCLFWFVLNGRRLFGKRGVPCKLQVSDEIQEFGLSEKTEGQLQELSGAGLKEKGQLS
jgi:hypothetical protein